jgi:hypothetical protein
MQLLPVPLQLFRVRDLLAAHFTLHVLPP